MFDFRLLTPAHLLFLIIPFALSHLLIRRLGGTFFVPGRSGLKYAGAAVALSALLGSAWAIPNLSLVAGLIIATLLILIVGRADERSPLSAPAQLFWQLVICAILILFDWTIPYVSNPFGEGVFHLGGFSIFATLGWLLLMMNALNWLDGVDGLAASVATIGFITLAAISLLPSTQDPTTLALALIGAGSLLGFLFWNWPPASVYLGTSGSWFVGLFLGLTAMIGGGKIATTLLVLALPAIDVVLVIIQRLVHNRAPWQGDRSSHLHFRLQKAGLNDRFIVLSASVLSLLLGISAVLLPTPAKLLAILVLAGVLSGVILKLSISQTKKHAV